MKKLILILSFFQLASCGEDSNNTQSLAEQLNTFNIQALESDQIEAPYSLIGLWESDIYQHNGITMQIRWQIQADQTTLTKKCISEKSIVYFAQVTSSVETNIVQQNNITTSSVTLSDSERKTDIVEMGDGRVCRVSLDPQKGDNQSIIQGSGDEILLSSSTIKNGQIELLYVEESKAGHLTKIGN